MSVLDASTLPVDNVKPKNSSFLRYMHNFRGLAIILIVIAHTLQGLTLQSNSSTQLIAIATIQNGSTYFVFIAGFLFQHLSKRYDYGDYLIKKAQNVILPYILISIPAIFWCFMNNAPSVGANEIFLNLSTLDRVVFLYTTGRHLFTLWFIPMISLFYIISPVFIWIDRNPKSYKVLPLLFLLSLCVNRTPDNEITDAFLHFLSIYTLGMLSSHYKEALLSFVGKAWPILTSLVALLLSSEIALRLGSDSPQEMLSFNTLTKAILCILFMYGLWRFDARIPSSIHYFLGVSADLSFGIFFLHGYLIQFYFAGVTNVMGIDSLWRQGNILAFLTLLTFQLVVSIYLLRTIKSLLHKKSRYLVGC